MRADADAVSVILSHVGIEVHECPRPPLFCDLAHEDLCLLVDALNGGGGGFAEAH